MKRRDFLMGSAASVISERALAAASTTITVTVLPANNLPQVLSAQITGSATVGSVLTLSATYSNSPTSIAYQWKSNGTNVGTNTTTYTTVSGDLNHTITCTITPTNASGSGTPYTASFGPIVNAGAGMTLTLTFPPQYAWTSGGTYVFSEATATTLDSWSDPRGVFTLNMKQATNAGLPGFRVIFVRSVDGQWASVEMWYGDASLIATLQNIGQGYTATVTGDFAGSATTPNHWFGSRWRLSGTASNGLRSGRNDWPYALTSYSTLTSDGLIPQFDPSAGVYITPVTATPYSPMGSSDLVTYMPQAGGRPDIGIFTAWSAAYVSMLSSSDPTIVALRPQALAALNAINEAGASVSWFWYDAARGCMWERLVNHAGDGFPPFSEPFTYMGLIATGPVGARLASTVSDPGNPTHGGWLYHVPSGSTIPAGGTLRVRVQADGYYMHLMPTNAIGIVPGTDGDPGITYSWDNGLTYNPATPWAIDTAHQPELGYLSYLLYRDPWDLHSVQAGAMWAANNYPQFNDFQMRQVAWDYARAVQGWAATPASGPSWLLPRSTFATWLSVIQQWLITNAITSPTVPTLKTVFHLFSAAKTPAFLSEQWCNGTQTFSGYMVNAWQEAFVVQSIAMNCIANPADAAAQQLLAYGVQGVADRYSLTSGWPRGVRTPIDLCVGDGTHFYTSWSDAWTQGNAPWLQLDVNGCTISPLPAPPTNFNIPGQPWTTVNGTNADYVSGDFGALSLAVQAGLTQYRTNRDYIGATLIPIHAVPWERAFVQV